jgi:benzodiazapine receptor
MSTQTNNSMLSAGPAETSKWPDIVRQSLVILSLVMTIVVNGLANALPINGQNTGEISDRFDVYFVPAGYVFSIWSVIYVALIGYAIYQALPAQRTNPRLRSIGYLFVLTNIANTGWIFLWHYEYFAASLAVMIVLLLTLIAIYQRLNRDNWQPSTAEKWLAKIPFSIYLGWITVATIANATSVLDDIGWNGFGIAPEIWAVIMLAVATVVGLLFSVRMRDIAYVLVLVWATVGIAVEQWDTPLVAWSALIAAVILALSLLSGPLLTRSQPNSAASASNLHREDRARCSAQQVSIASRRC